MAKKKVQKNSEPKKFCFFKKHKTALLLALIILIQTVVFILVGTEKQYFHMDEAYSFGLSSYDKVEIHDNEDFYNTWHDGAYYADYLEVNDNERFNFTPVYENQKNDVHPPFYYFLLRIFMEFSPNRITKWGGIILNIIIYALITVFTFLITKRLWAGKYHADAIALAVALTSSVTLAALTSVVYIRMYALSTLNIAIITYLHLRLIENYDRKTLILISLSALIGSLTHYFFLFYLLILFIMTLIRRIKNKEKIAGYIIAIAVAAVLSLLIFPYSIQHILFSNRGAGAVSGIFSPDSLSQISEFLDLAQTYTFNGMLIPITITFVLLLIISCRHLSKIKINRAFWYVFCPTIFYFLLTAVASPYIELRYIMPICGMFFVVVIYLLDAALEIRIPATITKTITAIVLVITLITPFITKTEPMQILYRDKKTIVTRVEDELNLPTVYWFNKDEDRFLDDIYLFTKLDNSYISRDNELTAESIKTILEGKDLSKGLIVFINANQDNEKILETFMKATSFGLSIHEEHMNACDIYLLKGD